MPSNRKSPRQHTDRYADRYIRLEESLQSEFIPPPQEAEPLPPPAPFPASPAKRWRLWRPMEHRPETLGMVLQMCERLQSLAGDKLVVIHPDMMRVELLSYNQSRLALGGYPNAARHCHERIQARFSAALTQTVEVPEPQLVVHRTVEQGVSSIDVRLGLRGMLDQEAAAAIKIANGAGCTTTMRPVKRLGIRIAAIRESGSDEAVLRYKEGLGDIAVAPLALGPLQVPGEYPPLTIPLLPMNAEIVG